ncbi:uncharacterized protein XM38_018470 [Halomicronema hongdechloris C2206]|uniref:Orc1-like AAA ATPase domain-containing protein n=1 Tax=Halomicronema hongdechloris C2206 TaxID=1641165 RepID=A0A1Z3HKR0_9CYAN|nr:ATP-binding protein [Halomicronema hongdechloris]ASC70899.1 uncharacterized protein XM38_018470 [Halomicronema hongdechloris C2206]
MPAFTSLDEINRAIQTHNPFDRHFVVKTQQIWANELPDIPSINSHASKAILDAAKKIEESRIATLGIALLAPKGRGKTHILSRIRHRLQEQGNGVFVYLSEYGNLSSIKHQFLQGLVLSLRKPGSQEVMQCQEVVTALLNHALEKDFTPHHLIAQFPRAVAKNPQLIEKIIAKVFQLNLGVEDPYIIRALLWTLSAVHAPYALNWLAGKEITESQANRLGLPEVSERDQEIYAFSSAMQLLNLISHYKTPIICFDELDGAECGDEDVVDVSGFTRAMVVASLGKDIYNSLRCGILVTTMYPQTWQTEVKILPQNEAIEDRIAEQKIELRPLNEDTTVELVKCWLQRFYQQHDLEPPHELYPFDESELRDIGRGKPTVREFLKLCAERFSVVPIDSVEEVSRVYDEIESSLEDILDDNQKIANALAFAFTRLSGQTLEGVTIESVDREVAPKYKSSGYMQFRIIGRENGNEVKIGVGVLQNSHGKSVGAGIKRLTWYRDFDLTRGCLVRSKTIAPHWRTANDCLRRLTQELGGEWAGFQPEEMRPLIALREVARSLEDYDLSQDAFEKFLNQRKDLILENLLIREILSDPSGEAPVEVTDEDEEFERAIAEAAESDDDVAEELLLAS